MVEAIKTIYEEVLVRVEQEQERAVAEALAEAEQKYITPKDIELEEAKVMAIQQAEEEYQITREKIVQDYEDQKRRYRDSITSRTECAVKNQFINEINEIKKKLEG